MTAPPFCDIPIEAADLAALLRVQSTTDIADLEALERIVQARINHALAKARARIEQLNAKYTCMCGLPVDEHTIGDGHSPVPMYDYALEQAEQRAESAERERDEFRAEVERVARAWADVCDEELECERSTVSMLSAIRALKDARDDWKALAEGERERIVVSIPFPPEYAKAIRALPPPSLDTGAESKSEAGHG